MGGRFLPSWVRSARVGCRRGSTCFRVTIFLARSVRSFFSACDRASTRPFVDARGPLLDVRARARFARHRSNLCDRPAGLLAAPQSGIRLAMKTRSRGHIELARSRRDSRAVKAANQHRHKSRKGSPCSGFTMLHFRSLTRRIGPRWEPTRAPRQGSKRNEGGPSGSPLFFAPCRHSSLSCPR